MKGKLEKTPKRMALMLLSMAMFSITAVNSGEKDSGPLSTDFLTK